jgi:hypothetical protein
MTRSGLVALKRGQLERSDLTPATGVARVLRNSPFQKAEAARARRNAFCRTLRHRSLERCTALQVVDTFPQNVSLPIMQPR